MTDAERCDPRPVRALVGDCARAFVTLSILRRSVITALVVGLALFAVNQGARILDGPWDAALVAQLAATVAIPFFVSTIAAVLTRREMGRGRATPPGERPGPP